MNSHHSPRRKRSDIIADINAIQNTVKGTLTVKKRKRADGETSLYYQLQSWENKKNITTQVHASQVEAVKKGIENRKRLEALMGELLAADTLATLAPETKAAPEPAAEAKKKRTKSSPRSPGTYATPSPTRSPGRCKTDPAAR